MAPAAASPPPQPRPQPRAAARHVRDLVLQRKPGLPPPVLAAALGLIVGGLPFLSSAFIGDGAPLRSTVTDAAELLARAAVPISTINLGASLSAGQRAGGLAKGLRPVAVASAGMVRLLVAPAVSIAASVALRRVGALPADRLLLLVLMIEAAPPPAMQLMVLVQLFEQAAERPLGTLLAFLYPASLVTLTLWIAGILQVVPWIEAQCDESRYSSRLPEFLFTRLVRSQSENGEVLFADSHVVAPRRAGTRAVPGLAASNTGHAGRPCAPRLVRIDSTASLATCWPHKMQRTALPFASASRPCS